MGICGDINGPASILRQLHGMLEFDPLEDERQFQALFSMLTGKGKVEPQKIARALDVNASTVLTWTMGYGIPAQSEWPAIVQSVMILIARVLREEYPDE
jgi:hypothetical protein